jgi:hypothetical protein
MFERLEYNDKEVEHINLDELDLAQKYVKLVVVNKTDFYKFDKFIQKLYNKGCYEIKIIEDFSEFEADVIEEDKMDVEDTMTVLSDFVDTVSTDLDKDKIKNMLRTLYIEAQHVSV